MSVSADDLAAMTTDVESIMDQQCIIVNVERTPNGRGGSTETETDQPPVNCIVWPPQALPTIQQSTSSIRAKREWTFLIPKGTAVTEHDRIKYGTPQMLLDITGVADPVSYDVGITLKAERIA